MAVEGEGLRFTVACDSDHLDAAGVPELVTRVSEATARISEATTRISEATACKIDASARISEAAARKIEASARKTEVWAHEFRPRGSQTSEQADKKIGLCSAKGVDHQTRLCYCYRSLGCHLAGSRHRLVYRRP